MPATMPATVQGDGGLYGTASDYGLFLRMLLNRGKLGGKRILSEKSVKTMLESQHGQRRREGAAVGESVALEELPGRRRQGQLGTRLSARRGAAPNRRSPGSGTWAGIFNTHFFIDPSREIGVVVMMQTLPFYDEASMKVYAGAEEAVYSNLK